MKVPTVLVTGATGRTGHFAIEYLTKQGVGARALAHRQGPETENLQALGAEVVIGNLLSLDDVARALEEIQGAYFCVVKFSMGRGRHAPIASEDLG